MRSSLEIWDVAVGASRVVLQSDAVVSAPNWSPCGSYLLVNSGGLLYRVPLAAPALHRVETCFADRCNNDHGISPDGSTIALSHHAGRGAEIYLLPEEGGVPQPLPLPAPSWWHGFARDGRGIVYVAARGGLRVIDVYTLPLDGGPEVRLTGGEGHCDCPDYSADGAQIFYNCDRPTADSAGHAQIWVMAADGSGQRRLFADANVNWFPHPSPCGRHVIWLAYPPGTEGHPADLPVSLWIMAPDGSDRRRLCAFIGGQGTMNVPNWAPDGSAFAYVRYALPI